LRQAQKAESLVSNLLFKGYEKFSDVHLTDWGDELVGGIVLFETQRVL
jgi:hypothetical protein